MANRQDLKEADLEPWLEVLRGIPTVDAAFLESTEVVTHVVVQVGESVARYLVDLRMQAVVTDLMVADASAGRQKPSPLLFLAQHIPPTIADQLIARQIDFVDLAGNCHLRAVPGVVLHVEGKRRLTPLRRTRPLAARGSGAHVLFVLAARPELATATVRVLADLAGTNKSSIAEVLGHLEDQEVLSASASGRKRVVLRRRTLLDMWLMSYEKTLRPRWLVGRYRSATKDAQELEASIERALEGQPWAFGGSAAEMRLSGHYRGPDTIIHVAHRLPRLPKALRALPDPYGPIVVLHTPLPLAFEGPSPNVMHPLMVYSELMVGGDERAISAAQELDQSFLHLSS
jgi:hypothetical protein